MAQLLIGTAKVGFVTQIGRDKLSETFAAEMAADGLDVSGVKFGARTVAWDCT